MYFCRPLTHFWLPWAHFWHPWAHFWLTFSIFWLTFTLSWSLFPYFYVFSIKMSCEIIFLHNFYPILHNSYPILEIFFCFANHSCSTPAALLQRSCSSPAVSNFRFFCCFANHYTSHTIGCTPTSLGPGAEPLPQATEIHAKSMKSRG